jgi:copper chaperone
MEFHIEKMTCGGCARGVTRAIQALDAHAVVEAQPEVRRIHVTSAVDRSRIEQALLDAGFPASAR